jgi:hypothetical protein
MTLVEGLTIIALFGGPISSVCVGVWLQKNNAQRERRFQLFADLVAALTNAYSPERLRALAQIELLFKDYPSVLEKWRDWHEAVTNTALNDAQGLQLRNLRYFDLLTEMARSLGYEKLTRNEFERVYIPEPLGQILAMRLRTEIELNRILSNSETFGGRPRENPPSAPPPPPVIPP